MPVRHWALAGALLVTGQALQACGYTAGVATGRAGTMRVPDSELPHFQDDLMFAGMPEALTRQRAAGEAFEKVVLGGTEYSAEHVRRSGERFDQLVRETRSCLLKKAKEPDRKACFAVFERAISTEFAVYTTRSPARLTAYYTPTIDVSRKPDEEFRFAIYGLPDSPKLRRLSRRDIDFRGALAGRGLELFYARSRFDIYVLHVEGGGRVRIQSSGGPQIAYLSYAGDNGRRIRLIEEYMRRRGMLRREDVSRFAQRKYLQEHPEEAERIYASCPRFVFFRETQEPVVGSAGASLTASRSLASDPAHYPAKGLIAFVTAPLPLLPEQAVPLESNPTGLRYRQMTRFFLDQDEGPYIKGSARFDLFFGEDSYAEFLANNLDTKGRIHFLVLKQSAGEG